MTVWVVHWNTWHDGEFSSSNVAGVFTNEKDAESRAEQEQQKDRCKEVFVTPVEFEP